jgi:hypothetical protein
VSEILNGPHANSHSKRPLIELAARDLPNRLTLTLLKAKTAKNLGVSMVRAVQERGKYMRVPVNEGRNGWFEDSRGAVGAKKLKQRHRDAIREIRKLERMINGLRDGEQDRRAELERRIAGYRTCCEKLEAQARTLC